MLSLITPTSISVIAFVYLSYRMVKKAIEIYRTPFIAQLPKKQKARQLLQWRSDMVANKGKVLSDGHFDWLNEAKRYLSQQG